MNELSARFLDEALKGVVPYVTPWRCCVGIMIVLMWSPIETTVGLLDIAVMPLAEIGRRVVDALNNEASWLVLVAILVTFYVMPKISNIILYGAMKYVHIKKCEAVLMELVELKKRCSVAPNFPSERRVKELYARSVSAKKEINHLKLISEIIVSLAILGGVSLIRLQMPSLFVGWFLGAGIGFFFISRKIIVVYLTHVAKFSVIITARSRKVVF